MNQQSIKDITADINNLYRSYDLRTYHKIFAQDIETFSQIFNQAKNEILELLFQNKKICPEELLFQTKFEIDNCLLNYKGN